MRAFSLSFLMLAATAVAACGGGSPAATSDVTLDDWVGDWVVLYECASVSESGEFAVRIEKTGPSTFQVTDFDRAFTTPGLTYPATSINTALLTGTFTATDGGGTYDETFTWTMQTGNQEFVKSSEFLYTSGALTGVSGRCTGTGRRQP